MTISELIKPGDKVDLQLVQQIESAEKTGTKATVYKSQVLLNCNTKKNPFLQVHTLLPSVLIFYQLP